MKPYQFYLAAAGACAIAAAAPLVLDCSPTWFFVLLTAWAIGVALVPAGFLDIVSELRTSVLVFLGFGALIAGLFPRYSLFLLAICLLFVRSSELFGYLLGACVLAHALGLTVRPYLPLTAIFVISAVLASHFRAARTVSLRAALIAIVISTAALIAGAAATALPRIALALSGSWIPVVEDGAEPPPLLLLVPFVVLPLSGYLLIRFVGLRVRRTVAVQSEEQKTKGVITAEKHLDRTERRRFRSRFTNEAVVEGYISLWRKLGERGIIFRPDRTPEEGAAYLRSRLPSLSVELLSRLTQIFNKARYSPHEITAAEFEEFEGILRRILEAAATG